MTMATEGQGAEPARTELNPEVYDTYEAFLRQAIREYYDRGWKHRRGNFVALVIASGQIVQMATESIKDGTGLKKAAFGAAGVVALRFGLRYFFAGPVGLLLSAAAIASAVAYLVRNQKEISEKVGPYRTLIEETRARFDEIQGGYRAGRYDGASRNLMVEGLLKRMLEQIDA
jgi:hypothetical protein